MSKPLLLIDVDGVISLFGFDAFNPPAGRLELVDGIAHFLSASAGGHIRALASEFELAWCTGWEEKANEYLPLALGLPGPLPVVRLGVCYPLSGAHWKLAAIDSYAGPRRALAWLDDAHDDRCASWAKRRPAPTLLIATDPSVGLTQAHVVELRAWAQRVAETENTGGTRMAIVDQLSPPSAEPKTSPDVAPK
jgi:hypothetical protein